jgi:hypothetical protein
MTTTNTNESSQPARLLPVFVSAVVLLASVVAVGVSVSHHAALSLGLGVLLGAANLWVMAGLLSLLVFSGSGRLASLCGIGLGAKMLALVGAIYALAASALAEPIPLVIGCAACPLLHAFTRVRLGRLA